MITWIEASRRLFAAATLAFGLVGGGIAAQAAALETVTVRLDYVPGAYHGWLFLAKERGYYERQGIDVVINNGQGSVSTLQVVGAGNGTIGLANYATLAIAVSKGVSVVGIADILQRSPEAMLSLKKTNIVNPADLVGKRYGDAPNTACAKMFDAFAGINKIDLGKIRKIATGTSGLAAVVHGDVDFTCGWATTDALKIAKEAPINPPMILADYGVATLGIGLFVTKDTAATKADLLRRFMVASIQGADDVAKDPAAGVEAIMKAHPEVDREVITHEMEMLPPYLHTPHSAGHEFGWVAPEDRQQTVGILEQYFGLPPGLSPDQLYTNDFLPPAS
jgi:NitT/TauT family transport system substrate-binding protein